MNLIGGDDPKGLSPISITARNSITLQLNFFQVPPFLTAIKTHPFGKSRNFFQLISQFPAASSDSNIQSDRVAQIYETAHPHPPLQLLNSLNKTSTTCSTTLAKRLNLVHRAVSSTAHDLSQAHQEPRLTSVAFGWSLSYHMATSELPASIEM
jgi:hypothetical protein